MKIRRLFRRNPYRHGSYDKTTAPRRRTLSLETLESRTMLNAVNPFGLSPATAYNVGHNPVSIVNADLNNDGYLDLAVANKVGNTVSVLLGNNDGTFATQKTYAVGTTPMTVIAADANNDGRLDILTANSGSNSISILLRRASGGFASAITVSAADNPESLAVGDVNNDGINDIVVTNTADRAFSLLLGQSKTSASFAAPVQFQVGNKPVSILLADFNKDTYLDVATVNRDDNTASVLLGNGVGQFTSQIAYATGAGPQKITTGVLTGDPADPLKYTDLVIASRYDNTVTVLLNNGNGSFTSQGQTTAGTWSAAVAIGDINGDNLADLVTADEGDNTISVLCGQGDGTFGPKVSYAVGKYPDDVTLGDFDGDGHLDIATANHLGVTSSNLVNTVSVLLGDRRFDTSVQYNVYDKAQSAIGTLPNQAVLGDVNNDGYSDIVTVNQQSGNLSVLLNDKTGAFGAPLAPLPNTDPSPRSMALGDLDGDGNLDAVACCVGAAQVGTVSILKGNGNGTFQPQTSMAGFGNLPVYVTLADLDNDGNLDLVTVNQKGDVANPTVGSLSVAFGNGDATFTAPIKLYVGPSPRSVCVGDADNDGFLDLVATSQTSRNVALLINNGNRTFQAAAFISSKQSPFFAKMGDVDNDGDLDIVTTNYANKSISVMLGDNTGAFAAPIVSQTRYMPYGLELEDFNGSGILDVAVVLPNQNRLAVLDGDGTGNFASEHNYKVGNNPVSIAAADLDGNGQLDLVTADRAVHGVSVCLANGYLDTVAQSTYEHLKISANATHWYSINTGTTGILSIEVIYQGGANDVGITLYNATGGGTALATSTATALPGGYYSQRIDYASAEGITYTFKLTGANADATLHVSSSSGAAIYGTSGDDVFTLTEGAPNNTVTVVTNAVTTTYTFVAATVKSYWFNGLAGTDQVNFTDTAAADDTAVIYPTAGTMSHTDLGLEWINFEEAILNGGGGTNTAYFYDSAGNDTFIGTSTYARLHGTGFNNYAGGFGHAYAYSTAGGNDIACLYDSAGDDTFVGTSDYARLLGTGFYNYAGGFRYAYAYSTAGGTDRAYLYDSAGDDTFVGTSDYAKLLGTGFYNYARGFRYAYAYSTAGGTDRAYFYDSAGDDTFVGTSDYAKLLGNNFYNHARGFNYAYAYSTAGGTDRAYFYDSAGDDSFAGTSTYAALYGNGFYNYARGFRYAYGYSTSGGTDRAYLYDSAGDDTFVGNSTYARMYGSGYYNYARGFRYAYAYATAGGTDTANLYDSAGDDTFTSNTTYSIMSGSGYSVRAQDFDTVLGQATAGGTDRAYLADAPGNYTLLASGKSAKLSADAPGTWSTEAYNFDWVEATASSGGGTHTKIVNAIDYILATLGPWV